MITTKDQAGLSLVELLISMTLGLFIVGMATQVFLTGKNTHKTVNAVSSIQDNARYSMFLLEKDVRMAGYTGCATRDNGVDITNTLNDSDEVMYDFSSGLFGFNNVSGIPTSLATPLASDPPPLTGTDILVIRGPIDDAVQISRTNNSSQLFALLASAVDTGGCADGTDKYNGICIGDILMVTDCAKARVFQVTNLTLSGSGDVNVVHSNSGATPGNDISSWGGASAPEGEQFDTDGEITRISTVIYYIANSPDSNIPSLYRKEGDTAAVLIADGIQDMQLDFGVDNNGDYELDAYQDASSVSDWESVLAVKAKLLLISNEDNVLDNKQTYTFNGTSSTAGNYRLHYALTSTITLRNRVP